MACIFSDHLSKRFAAGGVTGLHAMTKAAADGYTITVGTSGGLAIYPVLIKDKTPYKRTSLSLRHGRATRHPGRPPRPFPSRPGRN
jgi:hypothetical protein